MITLGGDAELELVDSLDPFSEGIVFRCEGWGVRVCGLPVRIMLGMFALRGYRGQHVHCGVTRDVHHQGDNRHCCVVCVQWGVCW